MSRQRFRSWGARLSELEFANALAALGSTGAVHPAAGATERLAWQLPPAELAARWLPTIDASELAARWRATGANRRVMLEVPINTYGGWSLDLDAVWLVETLRRAEGVRGVVLTFDPRAAPHRRWGWPVDVGHLGDRAGVALRAAVQGHAWPDFARHVDAAWADAQIDLLLLPGTLAQAVAALVTGPRLAEVHTVLAIGGHGRAHDPIALLAALRSEAGAVAAGVVDLVDREPGAWLGELLGQLSHGISLDDALFGACGDAVPLVLAPDGALEHARASSAAVDLGRRLEGARRARPSHTAPGPVSFDESYDDVEELAPRAAKLDWSRKSETARELVELTRAAAALPRREPARFVQGKLYVGDVAVTHGPLEPGAVHRLDIRVGRPADDWASAPSELAVPPLAPGEAGHALTVVFVAASVLPEPQTATIWLPVHGDSQPCSFHFVPRAPGDLDARVTVLYQNRILQTLRIRSAVGRGSSDTSALSLELESVLRADLDGVSGSPGFDVAFFFNDVDGDAGLTAFGPSTAFVRLDSVQALLRSLRDELEKVTRSPEDYEAITSADSVALLVTLARAGAGFGKALRRLPHMERALAALGDTPGRVQIASIHPDELVPLELIYDWPFPATDAQLCPALRAHAACSDACPRDEHTVCARGFWGLRHVIERRLYNERDAGAIQASSADLAIAAEPCEHRPALSALHAVLLGAADRAANFDRAAFEGAMTEIQRSLAGIDASLIRASTWPAWVTRVADSRPDLLLLIAHTEEEMGAAVLELGGNDHLAAAQVEARHVSAPPPAYPTPGPIVILLGCRTATKEVPFSDFISAFREAHASVVIATISTVRGRHMAPLAREAIDLMVECQARSRCSVGEYLRDLRLRALARNLPIGLALVGYGEVDWRIGGSHDSH